MATTTDRQPFRAALVQLCAGRDVARNVAAAEALIREAAKGGAAYVQTPEVTTLIEPERERLFAAVVPEAGNPALAVFQALAAELGIWLHIGSMAVLASPDKVANRAMLIRPDGRLAARYDKIHMFDVTLAGGEMYRESKNYRPGDQVVLADLLGARLGITICYDLRFPYLYRALAKAGAEVLTIPSAFTVQTGEAHWHALMRARAIENGCFVLAAAQAGTHESGRKTYGHSIAIGPWGEVLAEGDGTSAGVIFADIDPALVGEARRRVPSLEHDRGFTIATVERD
jgi:deaminated glutathione amidase